MLNWEYDAEAERRVLYVEAWMEGFLQGLYQAKLEQDGMSYEDALKKATEHNFELRWYNGRCYPKNPPQEIADPAASISAPRTGRL